MTNLAPALTDVPTADLEKLLRYVHRGELPCPIGHVDLARVGLQHVADLLGHLRGLDALAVKAVVVAVIAERRAAGRARRLG